MPVRAAIRLACHLNAIRHGRVSVEVAARAVQASAVAHHVVDTDGLLGLDPLRANTLEAAIAAALVLTEGDWQLRLPRPGAPDGLRAEVLAAALDVGAVVLPTTGGLALIPLPVGAAVQWRVLPADPPAPGPSPAEAERELGELILDAGRRLADVVPVVAMSAPRGDDLTALAPGYPARQVHRAERALRLLEASEAGLDSVGLSSFHDDQRSRILRSLRDAAAAALATACRWPDEPRP